MNGDLKNLLDEIKQKRSRIYSVLNLPLDGARVDFELTISGTYLYTLILDGTASVKFNEITADSIDLFKSREITCPYYRLYISNTAQATKSLILCLAVSKDIFSINDETK